MQNAGYLFAAYTIIWLVIFGYMLFLIRRLTRVKQEIDMLKGHASEDKNTTPK